MNKIAPSYVVSIAGILTYLQGMIGLDLMPEQIQTTVYVLAMVVVAVRQVITGRSTVVGGRPE